MPPKKQAQGQEDQEQAQTTIISAATTTASFSDFNLKAELMQAIQENGFERPSDVQALAIPYCLERRDVRVQAKSGKGKTCVFVLSILNMLERGAHGLPQALVLCNTRELALQISDEFTRFAKHLQGITSYTVVGKTPLSQQQKELKTNKHAIIVGTLGRLSDLIRRGDLDFSKLQYLVIDEADMLVGQDENKEALAEVLSSKPPSEFCQTMIFSATFSEQARLGTARLLREGFREVRVDDQNLVLNGLV